MPTQKKPGGRGNKSTIHPNSLKNLALAPRTGKKAKYDEPKKRVDILLTASTKEGIQRRNRETNPIYLAGYASVSELIELAYRGVIELPPKPKGA